MLHNNMSICFWLNLFLFGVIIYIVEVGGIVSVKRAIVYLFVLFIFCFLIYFACLKFMNYRYSKNMNSNLSKVNVTVSKSDLVGSDVVSFEHIEIVNLDKAELPKDIYINFNEIIGLCVKEGKKVKNGDYFYKNYLTNCDNIDNLEE